MAWGSPQYAVINASGSGNNTIVAAVPGSRILVLGYTFICTAAVTVTWQDGASTAISGPMSYAANGGATPTPTAPIEGYFVGQFQTSAGNALVMNLGSGVQVSGHLVYVLQTSP